jgi:hypothetical protein
MANYGGELGKAGIEHVAIFVSFVKVNIGATNSTSSHAQEHLSGPGLGLGDLLQFQFRIAPDISALDSLTGFPLELRELVTGPRFPFGLQN